MLLKSSEVCCEDILADKQIRAYNLNTNETIQ